MFKGRLIKCSSTWNKSGGYVKNLDIKLVYIVRQECGLTESLILFKKLEKRKKCTQLEVPREISPLQSITEFVCYKKVLFGRKFRITTFVYQYLYILQK